MENQAGPHRASYYLYHYRLFRRSAYLWSHRTRRSTWGLEYSKDITTTTELRNELDEETSLPIVARNLSVIVLERLSFSTQFQTGKTTLDLTVYNDKRDYQDVGQDEETVKRLLDDMYQSNKATRGVLTSDQEPPLELESVRQRLGWIPSWIEVLASMGKSTTELFRHDFTQSLSGTDPYGLTLDRLPLIERLSGRDPLNQSLYLWSRITLPNFILTLLGDRMEMAHSLEGRVPFLDHNVAEYAANIPINMKVKGMREKHVLREASKDVIIEDVYNREKHPFTSPPAQKDDDPMFTLFEDVLNSRALDEQPVYDPQSSRQLLKELRNSPPEERFLKEGMVQRIVSTTIMHERFAMDG